MFANALIYIYIIVIHKSILFFQTNPCQHPIIILRDVKEHDLKSLLKFMYNGEIQIAETRLAEFLKTADTLQIQGLADGAATAIPTTGGRGRKGGFADVYDDEGEDQAHFDSDRNLNNGDRGMEMGSDDDDIEEVPHHERGGVPSTGEGMTNLLRSQRRMRRRQHQSAGRSDNLEYDDIAAPEDDDERGNTDNAASGSKRRDQGQKTSSVST